MSTDKPADAPRRVSGRKLAVAGLVVLAGAAAIVANGIMAREKSGNALREWTEAQALPSVAVAYPESRAQSATLELPGRIEAYARAPIFARVSGYLKGWSADIGSAVKAGQAIAEIEAPDLDQQLLQARADLASAQSSARLSEATLNRRKSLLSSNFVSMQEIDERTADLSNKKAAVNAQQANVDRLVALAGFKTILAPFDGVVTERNTDVGALINAGGGAGPALFVVSDLRRLRVYVNAPQTYAPMLKVGGKAEIVAPEYPTRTFPAVLEASSQVVDVATGTTRMQLGLDNADGALMPGSFANVRLTLARDGASLTIPASALIVGKGGLRVATVVGDDRVQMKAVTIARDLGRDIELASGLSPDDRVIITPPDGITDGEIVRVVSGPAAKNGKPAAAGEPAARKG